MSFLENAQLFIPALSGVSFLLCDEESQSFDNFEKKFCFMPEIQPLYTTKGLRSFLVQKEKNRIYEVTDVLETHVIIMNIEGQSMVLGPYVTTGWQDNAVKVLLARCGIQADKFISYKMYRCSLPLIAQNSAEDIALFVLKNMVGNFDFEPVHIDLTLPASGEIFLQTSVAYSESEQVNRRYALEMRIMDAVRKGDAVQVLRLLRDYQDLKIGVRFLTGSLNDKIASAFALRVLIRHAALQAGLAPVFVDALSQEYAQKMHRAVDGAQVNDLMRQYIIAFCQAVREKQKNDYSPYVKRAIQYIELQLSQPLSVDDLCKLNHITRQYFSQIFKKETGKTVKQYVMQARCERAAMLLESSNLPVQKISQYVGYEDTNYFARVFKGFMGMSPQEYRRQKAFCYDIS